MKARANYMNMLRKAASVALAMALMAVGGAGLGQAQTAPANDVVATVNGKPIPRALFVERLEQMAGERVLADLIARALFADAFDKAGLQLTPTEVDAEIAKIKQQAPDEASWQQFLAQQGMTEAALREVVAFNLKIKKLTTKDVKVTDEALKQYFAENAEAFGTPEVVVLSEIVVRDKQKAQELRDRLHKPGVDFATLARENSLAPSRAEGGRRPPEPVSGIEPEGLREIVATMKLKEVSQPVAAENVWWLLRLEQRQPAAQADYEQVKEQVRERFVESQAREVKEMLQELGAAALVQIHDAKYEKVQRMFGPQAAPAVGGAPQ